MLVSNNEIIEIKNRITDYFKHGYYYYILHSVCDDDDNYEKYSKIWYNYIEDNQIQVKFPSGCTKNCIIWEDLDYIVKIPRIDKVKQDYCELESKFYSKAVEENLNSYFAAEYYIGIIPDFPMAKLYIQEKAYGMGDLISDVLFEAVASYIPQPENEEEDISDQIYDELDSLDDTDRIEVLFGEDYPAEEVDKLIQFCIDNNINDLHSGNIGYNKDGYLILVDYSGYNN